MTGWFAERSALASWVLTPRWAGGQREHNLRAMITITLLPSSQERQEELHTPQGLHAQRWAPVLIGAAVDEAVRFVSQERRWDTPKGYAN
jgi:hypothetical protein